MKRILVLLLALAATPVAAAPGSLPVVKLVSPGSGPRQALRLEAPVGTSQTMTVATQVDMTMGLGSAPTTTAVPTIALTVKVDLVDKTPEGNLHCKLAFTDAKVVEDGRGNAFVVDATKDLVKSMKGITGDVTISPTGMTLSSHLDLPASMSPQLRQQMSQMQDSLSNVSAPFPTEAVGVGARWKILQDTQANGLTIHQTTSARLVSRKGNKVVVALAVSQTAPKQQITNPQLPPGSTMHVLAWKGSGIGSSQIDLGSSVLPSAATVDLRTGGTMRVEMGTMKQDMKIEMHAKVDVK